MPPFQKITFYEQKLSGLKGCFTPSTARPAWPGQQGARCIIQGQQGLELGCFRVFMLAPSSWVPPCAMAVSDRLVVSEFSCAASLKWCTHVLADAVPDMLGPMLRLLFAASCLGAACKLATRKNENSEKAFQELY